MGKILRKPKGFVDNFVRKPGNYPKVTHYCPGCGHGRIHKLIAEAMEELDIIDRTVFLSPVGCSVFGYYYFNCGNIQCAHGRAPAVGTGVARSIPEAITISYQGDGDLAAIGTAEIIHAANRGESMTVFFVNNQIYGMTGGQMAPTTLENQKTATTPTGRDTDDQGHPIRMSEIISSLESPVFVERCAVTDAKHIMKTKKAIRKALESQKAGLGFSFVEILSACPIGWKITPVEAIQRIEDVVMPYFPVKNFKDVIETRKPAPKKTPISEERILQTLGIGKNTPEPKYNEDLIKNFTTQRIRVAGFGGQGVLMAGIVLGHLGMDQGIHSTWLPSYGPEMRGGTANCHVVLSNKEVGSPIVEKPNVLIAMNAPSLDTFEPTVAKDGLIVVNSAIVERKVKRDDVKAVYIPMTEIAEGLGLREASNMVGLVAYLAHSKVFSMEQFKEIIRHNFKKKDLITKNLEIIDKSLEFLKESRL